MTEPASSEFAAAGGAVSLTERVPVAYVLADSTGGTATNVAKAARFQYDPRLLIETIPELTTLEVLNETLAKIEQSGTFIGPVFTSFVVPERSAMEDRVRDFARQHGVPYVPVVAPALEAITQTLGIAPKSIPGFMTAPQFATLHDDGLGNIESLREAKIIFVGVSRTGKTSMCAYIANHYGLRVANCPFAIETGLPQKILDVDGQGPIIIALTKKPERLQELRDTRSKLSDFGAAVNASYVDLERIYEEQDALVKLARQRSWRILDVTTSLPEESARKAIGVLNIRRKRAGLDPYNFAGLTAE